MKRQERTTKDEPPANLSAASSSSASTTTFMSTTSDGGGRRFQSRRNKLRQRSFSLSHLHSAARYNNGDVIQKKERLLRTNSQIETSAIRRFDYKQKLTLFTLALVDFMSFCSMSIMAPFFPREATEKGLSDTTTGFVFSFYALVMFVTSPIFGKILPKLGAKFLFITGIFVAGACNLLFGMLEYVYDYTLFTTLCIVIRGLEAVGASAFSTASYVFVVNAFPNNIGSVLGTLETFIGLGMSVGPAIGGWLYSLGGFQTPFFVLGFAMILIIPLNYWLLPPVERRRVEKRNPSVWKLIRMPAVIITGSVIVVVSSTWAFLDPTLEPHLREFNLTPEQVGLIFLLFSALYGIFSPIWGCLADKIDNHWWMMVWGLLLNTIGLFLLGPCPLLPFVNKSIALNLVSLSILGVSVALALLPTFQGVLNSAIEGGFDNGLGTYSVVAGLWSCMYSLGEVIGPTLGGFLMQYYGFPITSTVMACTTLFLAFATLIFFAIRSCNCNDTYESCDSGLTDSWRSAANEEAEDTPLLFSIIDNDNHRLYTQEKVEYYEHSRKLDNENGVIDHNQLTDIRGTVFITPKGSCEV